MANRQEWEHPTAITGAWPSSAAPDRADACLTKRSTDQKWSSLAVQTVGAAAAVSGRYAAFVTFVDRVTRSTGRDP
jgi:hypothetical protein